MPSKYSKEYYLENSESYKRANKKFYNKNREKIIAYQQGRERNWNSYREKCRDKAIEQLGGVCFLCGGCQDVLCFHEKRGLKHPGTASYKWFFDEPERYGLLCRFPCHRFVHNCMKYLGLSWDEIMVLVKEKQNGGCK